MRVIVVLCFVLCWGCHDSSRYKFRLKGDIDGIKYGKAFLIMPGDTSKVLFSTDLDDGKFEFRGELDEPGRYVLKVNRKSFYFFMDGKDMSIDCSYGVLGDRFLKGSPANDLEAAYGEMMRERFDGVRESLLRECRQATESGDQVLADVKLSELLAMESKRFELTREFVREYPDNIFSGYISNVVKADSYENGKVLYDLLSEKNKSSFFGRLLKKNTDVLAVSALGYPCPDFVTKDEAGKEITLNAQKGNILVLDFWASWCGPCRTEMKNLREQYGEFKDRGVHFMSISLDDSADKWKKACEEEQIPWLSVHDDKGWAGSEIRKLFGIESIPFIVLLDQAGNIVAKNIRRNALREKIIELLEKK